MNSVGTVVRYFRKKKLARRWWHGKCVEAKKRTGHRKIALHRFRKTRWCSLHKHFASYVWSLVVQRCETAMDDEWKQCVEPSAGNGE